ncbi:MAG: isocitrate lyase/PEP mutase family protein [Alphaproteobacteria bacterium]|nr:isocitrate lyase/PEP mutase family protein [Alphaproteobacteria bacterium]MDP6621080.1 isocitrate lyase/PEP mutase family protein [Alphaproteobacteria bacterium]
MSNLRAMIAGKDPVCAPLVLNPLMAKLAEEAGFSALYLGGGASGYVNTHLEANLTLTEMAQAGLEIRAACELPLILDAAAGWGDPMHLHRTVSLAEAAGFAALEIEDQILPKRAHHHAGIEHMVTLELMVEKVLEAVAARRNPETLIIARTNGVRASSMDDALRRLEAYRAAGADVLLPLPYTAEDVRFIGERLEGPLMLLLRPGGLASLDMTPAEMRALGFCLLIDASTPLLAAYEAMRGVYAEMADGFAVRSRPLEDWRDLQEAQHATIDLQRLLDIETRTVEK